MILNLRSSLLPLSSTLSKDKTARLDAGLGVQLKVLKISLKYSNLKRF